MIVDRIPNDPSADIHGLILIDCWDYTNMPAVHHNKSQLLTHFYRNLINRIQRFDIKYVINAMTHTDQNCIDPSVKQEILDYYPGSHAIFWDEFLDTAQQKLNGAVTDWYVAGQTWQLCVHNNSIGLEKMSGSSDFNFYADEFSFVKNPAVCVEHADFKTDHLKWRFHSGFGYQLWRTV